MRKASVLTLIGILCFSMFQFANLATTAPVVLSAQESNRASDDFSIDTGLWEYLGSAHRDVANHYLVLTEAVSTQGGVVFFKTAFKTCFTANFSYMAGGGSGADGFALFFYKQKYSSYEIGGHLAFSDGPWPNPPIIYPGYGVEFDNYNNGIHNDPSANHIALIEDHVNNHLIYSDDPRTEDGLWHNVSVSVKYSSVEVLVDQTPIFQWNGTIDRTFDSFGFCGATGADNNWHIIDNFSLEICSPIEVPTDFPTIQEAINVASDGDTVFVRNGTYYENVVVDKSVSLIGENEETTVIDGNGTGNIIHIISDNVKVVQFRAQNSGQVWPLSNGIYVDHANNTRIENVTVQNCRWGISAYEAGNCLLVSNTVETSSQWGIWLWRCSDSLVNNNIAINNIVGIKFEESSNCTMYHNLAVNNTNSGLQLWTISNCSTISNTAIDNQNGIYLIYAEDNVLYHNNFANNEANVHWDPSYGNVWDNGFEGNYWSDYVGVDLFAGSHQNETGSDGIGDTPYVIDADNVDNYPLMRPYVPFDNQTIYIRADGSVDPSGAPIMRKGDVYSLGSNITSNSDGIIIERNNMTLNGAGCVIQGAAVYLENGILLSGRNNVTIQDIAITSFFTAIRVHQSSSNRIVENNIFDNSYGVWMTESSNCTIRINNMTNNPAYSILLSGSTYNDISKNEIEMNYSNEGYGIDLEGFSDWNILAENTIMGFEWGMRFSSSFQNTVYHNNLVNYTYIGVYLSIINWDNGCEGNYYSSYNGTDADGDGIGDTPFTFNEESADVYPLMNAYWSSCDINHDLTVNMKDIGISARAFYTRPGDEYWNPHADITGSQKLVPDGKVDLKDIGFIARHFGEHYP